MKPVLKEKLTHFFNILDNNKNGSLQEDDFVSIGQNICINHAIGPNHEAYQYLIDQSKELYNELITDLHMNYGDPITLVDWLSYFDKEIIQAKDIGLVKHLIQMTVKYVFDLYDQNGDGLISIDEFVDMFTIYGIDVKWSAKSFMHLDENGDEVISKTELVHAVRDFFISSDPGADGNWIFGNWQSDPEH